MISTRPTTPAGRALTLIVDNPGEMDAEAIAAHLSPAPAVSCYASFLPRVRTYAQGVK